MSDQEKESAVHVSFTFLHHMRHHFVPFWRNSQLQCVANTTCCSLRDLK